MRGQFKGQIKYNTRGKPRIWNGSSWVSPSLWGRRNAYVIEALEHGFGMQHINDYTAWKSQQQQARGAARRDQMAYQAPPAPGVNRPGQSLSSALARVTGRGGKGSRGVAVTGRNLSPGRAVSRSYTRPHAGGNRGYGDEHILVQQGLRDRIGLDVEIGPDVASQSGQEILDQMVAVNTLEAESRVVTSGNVIRISVDGYAVGDIDEVFHISNAIPGTDAGGGEWCKSFLMRGIPGDSFFLLRNPLVNGSATWDSGAGAVAIVTRTQDGPPRMITLGSEGFAVVDLLEVVGAANGTTRWGLQANQASNIAFASFFQRDGVYEDLIIAPRQ